MTNFKPTDTADELFLHLSFHLHDEATFNVDLARIESLMQEQFADSQSKIFVSGEEREAVYRVQKPVFKSTEEMKNFFKRVKLVFNTASPFQPHFTQFQESDGV